MNKIEDAGELPGLMIEEMMESASMVQGEEGEVREAEEKVIMSFLFQNKGKKSSSQQSLLGSVVAEGEGVVAVKAKAPLKWRQAGVNILPKNCGKPWSPFNVQQLLVY